VPVFGLWESALIFRTINGRRNIFGHVARRPATWKPPAPRLSHKCFGPPPGFGHLVEENKAATAPRACAPFLAFLALWLSVPFPHRFWAESSRLFRPAPPLSSSSKLKAFGARSGKTRAKQPENPKKKIINKEKLGKTLKTGARTSEQRQRQQNQNQQPK